MHLCITQGIRPVGCPGSESSWCGTFRATGTIPSRRGHDRGAVLLEVVLALGLFVGAAAMLGGALSAALDGVERQRLDTHAANLAVSALSEIQLGIRGVAESAPAPLEPPFDQWTVQVQATPVESELGEPSGLMRIEVVVRHLNPPVVHRLAQLMKPAGTTRIETLNP